MFRRQFINIIRRYSHNKCEKNISQINSNEEKLDLIKKQLWENNEQVTKLHGKLDIVFFYSCVSTIILFYKSI
jgi:hypothetical protein